MGNEEGVETNEGRNKDEEGRDETIEGEEKG